MTQNEAVVKAVVAVFGNNGKLDGAVPETGKWTDAQKQLVHAMVLESFKSGECVKASGGQTEADLIKYIPGLVNNHVRKDLKLNGGVKYEAKNPGIRAGTGDEAIKAMRTLLSITADPKAKAAIQSEIDKRLAELKPKQVIKAELLPESLRHLIPS